MPFLDILEQAQLKPLEESVDLEHWQDAAATELVDEVASGYKYVITSIIIQNLGNASVLDFYDAAAADAAEANHKISIDAKGTDTTVVTGLNLTFETAASVAASVCASAHDLKITLCGVRIAV